MQNRGILPVSKRTEYKGRKPKPFQGERPFYCNPQVWEGESNWTLAPLNKSGGFCFMRQCTKCQELKSLDQFGKGSGKDSLSNWCRACNSAYCKERRQVEEHKEPQRIRVKEYKRAMRLDPGYAQADREASKARASLRRQDEEYRLAELQRINESKRTRRQSDPEYRAKEQSREHNRRALTKEGYTPQEWLDLCNRYGNICLCCGQALPLTVDHVKPLSKGGTNTIDNIQPLCLSCNSSKGAKEIDYRW